MSNLGYWAAFALGMIGMCISWYGVFSGWNAWVFLPTALVLGCISPLFVAAAVDKHA
jgi:hypothetical protein